MEEISSIIITGIIIFVLQKIISDRWITPHIEFQKYLAEIETLMIRSNNICSYMIGDTLVSSIGTPIDQDIKDIRKEINLATWNLIKSYNNLFFLEKFFISLLGPDIKKVKSILLSLSVILCSNKDGDTALDKIKQIGESLRFSNEFLEK